MYIKACLFLLCSLFSIFVNNAQSCIAITLQPQDQLVLDNDSIELSLNASSSETLSYQWQIFNPDTGFWEAIFDGLDYTGTTTQTLSLTNVTPRINGSRFRVLVNGESVACNSISEEALIRYVEIRVNNIFTPNGDGFNDFLTINGITNSEFSDSKLQVYNRWGNLVYEQTAYQNDWDGTATNGLVINGSKKLPAGTYFYTLDLNFDGKKFSGWIYIVL